MHKKEKGLPTPQPFLKAFKKNVTGSIRGLPKCTPGSFTGLDSKRVWFFGSLDPDFTRVGLSGYCWVFLGCVSVFHGYRSWNKNIKGFDGRKNKITFL